MAPKPPSRSSAGAGGPWPGSASCARPRCAVVPPSSRVPCRPARIRRGRRPQATIRSWRGARASERRAGAGWGNTIGSGSMPPSLSATRSVLEAHLPSSQFATSGERVVQGQQMMQSASDIFLGWSEGVQTDQYHYRRQLRDMKCSAVVENMIAARLNYSAKICAWTLARAHARPGDALRSPATSGPRGGSTTRRSPRFAEQYAEQNDRDYPRIPGGDQLGPDRGPRGV